MSQALEIIEAYFLHQLDAEARQQFETRCSTDALFAQEVALYIAMRQAARTELLAQKQQTWAAAEAVPAAHTPLPPVKRLAVLRWLPYVAAACIIFIIAIFISSSSPHSMAAEYVSVYNQSIGQTMDASRDSLQLGIAAYKKEDYTAALAIFEGLQQSNPNNSDVVKYTGLTYLMQEKYDNALQEFNKLAAMKDLYSNSGNFWKAITLLHRNKEGDKEQGKKLLEQVVQQNEEGSQPAKELLNSW